MNHRRLTTQRSVVFKSPMAGIGGTRARLCVLEKSRDGFGFHVDMDDSRAAHVVWHVERGSAADSAGLRAGDAILAVNGRDARQLSHAHVVGAIRESGWRMKLLVCEFRTESTLNLAGLGLSGDVMELALSLESDPLQSRRRFSVDLLAPPPHAGNPRFNQGLCLEADSLPGRRRCSLDTLASPLATSSPRPRLTVRRFSQQLHSPPLFSLMTPMAPLKESKSSSALVKEASSQGPEECKASFRNPGEAKAGPMKKSSSVGSFLQSLSRQPYAPKQGSCQNEETPVEEAGESKPERPLSTPVEASAAADPSADPPVASDTDAPDREPPSDADAPSSQENGETDGAERRASDARAQTNSEGSVEEQQPLPRLFAEPRSTAGHEGASGDFENQSASEGSQAERESGEESASRQPMLCCVLCSFC